MELVVSAAASLTDALQVLGGLFEQEHPGVRVRYNFGPSGALARQIEQGAPVDVFVSASRSVTEALARAGLVEPGWMRAMAGNVVVVVVPAGAGGAEPGTGVVVRGWRDLVRSGVRRVAIGDPAYVPAGEYARQVLQHLGLWESVRPRLVLGMDVRQVLHYVARGEVDAGIVYLTDVAGQPGVRVVDRAPPGSHEPVTYPVAVVTHAPHPREARAFAGFLRSDRAAAVLRRFGFEPAAP